MNFTKLKAQRVEVFISVSPMAHVSLSYLYSFAYHPVLQQLKSPCLIFINCTPEILEQLLPGNELLTNFLQVYIPAQWTEFGETPIRYALDQLTLRPDSQQ